MRRLLRAAVKALCVLMFGLFLTPANAQDCPFLLDTGNLAPPIGSAVWVTHQQDWTPVLDGKSNALVTKIDVWSNGTQTFDLTLNIYDPSSTQIYSSSYALGSISGSQWVSFEIPWAFAPNVLTGTGAYEFELISNVGNLSLGKTVADDYADGACATCVAPGADDLSFRIWYQNPNPVLPTVTGDTACAPSTLDFIADGSTGEYVWYDSDTTVIDSTSGFLSTYTTATLTDNGQYYLTAHDNEGCTSEYVGVTGVINFITIDSMDVSNLNCYMDSSGAIDLHVTSNNAVPLTYSWSPLSGGIVDNQEDQSGLYANTYSVAISDAYGCSASATGILITEPTELNLGSASVTDLTCFESGDGEICIGASGGTGDHLFGYQSSSIIFARGPAYDTCFTDLDAGNYDVYVTDDNGCSDTLFNVSVTQPSLLEFTDTTLSQISCYGDGNGSIGYVMTGGTGPYDIDLWDAGETNIGSSTSTTASFTSLGPDTYLLSVVDDNGCTDTLRNLMINEPSELVFSSISVTGNACYGDCDGEILVAASGGTPWTTGSGGYDFSLSSGVTRSAPTGTSAIYDNLCADAYTIYVRDENGCSADSVVTVSEPAQLSVYGITVTNVTCNGYGDGTATINVSGGTTPYDSWDVTPNTPVLFNGVNTNRAGGVDSTFTDLEAGDYNVVITDDNGCTASGSFTVLEPAVISLTSAVLTDLDCYMDASGEISTSATGGTPYTAGFAYRFNFGAGFGTPNSITGLDAGVYTITVMDSTGCTSDSLVTLTEPDELVFSSVIESSVSCNSGSNGSVDATVTGGTSPYTWSFDGGLGFSGSSNETFNSLSASSYSIVVTDDNSCSASTTANVSEPSALATTVSFTNVTCTGADDGSIIFSGTTGGTPTYNYNVYDYTEDTTYVNLSGSFLNLPAGEYDAWVEDDNGCFTITENDDVLEAAVLLDVEVSIVSESACGDSTGIVSISISGGESPYNIDWNGMDPAALPSGNHTVTVEDDYGCIVNEDYLMTDADGITLNLTTTDALCNGICDGVAAVSPTGGTGLVVVDWGGADKDALCAGDYTVTATDDAGCVSSEDFTITEPDAINVAATITDEGTCGTNNGFIDVTVTGGTPGYSYSWADGQTAQDLSGLAAGTYTLTVTDTNDCESVNPFTITCTGGGGGGSTGIEEGELDAAISVYPNPNNGVFTIEVASDIALEDMTVRVLNPIGQVVFEDVADKTTSYRREVSVAQMAQGVYFVKISANNQQYVQRLLVQ